MWTIKCLVFRPDLFLTTLWMLPSVHLHSSPHSLCSALTLTEYQTVQYHGLSVVSS